MTAPNTKPEVILIRETIWESIVSDLGTFLLVLSLVGVGILTGSVALQWIGAFMAFVAISVKGTGRMKRCTYTIAGAREYLDKLEGGQP